MSIFEDARKYISSGIISEIVKEIDPGARIAGEGWSCKCPFHGDTENSMVVNTEIGFFNCLSGCGAKGDFITLVKDFYKISVNEAAELIIKKGGGVKSEPKRVGKKYDMPDPVMPIPWSETLKNKIKSRVTGEWSVNKYGKAVGKWVYNNEDGQMLWLKIRHEKGNKKDVSPYYWGADDKWHRGHPMPKDRPLYNIHKLPTNTTHILIVEGEKCADIKVDGFLLLTWDGGTQAVNKADWKPLKKHLKENPDCKLTIWPDLDRQKYKNGEYAGLEKPIVKQPGMKAALQILDKFNSAVLLNPYENIGCKNKSKGWDIADSVKEGMDPVVFIENCPIYVEVKSELKAVSTTTEHEGIVFPFQCLGYDESQYMFLQDKVNYPIGFKRGCMTKNHCMELVDLAWWDMNFSTKQGISWDTAINDIYRAQQKAGFFDPDNLRGAGFWKDGEDIILNTGRKIIKSDSSEIEYKDFPTTYNYIFSQKIKMDDWSGEISTDEQGKLLKNLFHAQEFENILQSYVVLGWSLIAQFGGLLKWRPHIWVTGSAKSGKSWVIENLVSKLLGKSGLYGSGGSVGSSVAATRRSLGQDIRPVCYDEMEPKNKDAQRQISQLVEIARNASSNASSESRLVNKSGGVDVFKVRSPFCFASVVPYFDDGASRSRFVVCNVSARNMEGKVSRTKELIKKGILDDPGIYRRRIFSQIDDVLKNIEILGDLYFKYFSDRRKSDMLAPIFAVIHALDHTGIVTDEWIKNSYDLLKFDMDATGRKDEEILFDEIMEIHIRISPSETKSIAEIIDKISAESLDDDKDHLERIGIKYIRGNDGVQKLAIAKNSSHLRNYLINTPYAADYASVLKRHPDCIKDGDRSERMAGKSTACLLLNYSDISSGWNEEVENDEIPF
jgi:putative DNA primase/helicase